LGGAIAGVGTVIPFCSGWAYTLAVKATTQRATQIFRFTFICLDPLYEEAETVSVIALLVMLPDLAVMFVVSVLVTVGAVASPELSIVAAAEFEVVHVTESVKFTVVPFWRTPVAVNCAVCPEEID
jgi:hypothetical protein